MDVRPNNEKHAEHPKIVQLNRAENDSDHGEEPGREPSQRSLRQPRRALLVQVCCDRSRAHQEEAMAQAVRRRNRIRNCACLVDAHYDAAGKQKTSTGEEVLAQVKACRVATVEKAKWSPSQG
jgi:hypothetical protein